MSAETSNDKETIDDFLKILKRRMTDSTEDRVKELMKIGNDIAIEMLKLMEGKVKLKQLENIEQLIVTKIIATFVTAKILYAQIVITEATEIKVIGEFVHNLEMAMSNLKENCEEDVKRFKARDD